MLINEAQALFPDPILQMIARGKPTTQLATGVYEIGHFGGSHFLERFERYPEFEGYRSPYGVADDVEQILGHYPELRPDCDRQFVLTIHTLRKADEPADGGWRWHKWGPYIGREEPQCEYLHDEPTIEQVIVYHIYERA